MWPSRCLLHIHKRHELELFDYDVINASNFIPLVSCKFSFMNVNYFSLIQKANERERATVQERHIQRIDVVAIQIVVANVRILPLSSLIVFARIIYALNEYNNRICNENGVRLARLNAKSIHIPCTADALVFTYTRNKSISLLFLQGMMSFDYYYIRHLCIYSIGIFSLRKSTRLALF